MKIYLPLILVTLLAGCSSNESMQSHYMVNAIKSAQEGDCIAASIELSKLKGRTEPSDDNLANALLIESSCYLNGDIIDMNYAKGSYQYVADKYPKTKAGHVAQALLADWDNVVKQKIAIKTNLPK